MPSMSVDFFAKFMVNVLVFEFDRMENSLSSLCKYILQKILIDIANEDFSLI